MIEFILFVIIIALIVLTAYREKMHYEHVKFLEDKLTKANPQLYWAEKNEGKKPAPNTITDEDSNEVPLVDIPMMEFTDRDWNIKMEGDSETPAEARARGETA